MKIACLDFKGQLPMKLRHKETGEVVNLPDYLPEYEDAKEIARVFLEAEALSDKTGLPPGIVSLKTFSGEIVLVSKIINSNSQFSYDKLIRIHLHLPPFTNISQQEKSTVWSVLVNGNEWSVSTSFLDHKIEKLEWNKESGWWAITEGIYAIHLEKISTGTRPPDPKKKSYSSDLSSFKSAVPASPEKLSVLQMRFQSWTNGNIPNE
jgi:hypothetical protein